VRLTKFWKDLYLQSLNTQSLYFVGCDGCDDYDGFKLRMEMYWWELRLEDFYDTVVLLAIVFDGRTALEVN
jgi:hypothetical protein